ncbi:DUF4097 family beta strand repeat-containing protein [Geosporobacter ferrireducens]|uniref:DUF4097 domain-containing protein n=1 Tax=Geosporobacter ferrireducens TaxID=1424294 RepID=A0A1D8GKH0_9FIRM|nr:DUF4097 family beta strand repeat-containing protein [Geosporobacter ferrireducens]AOT71404.1 hypothetical protein Gferi_18855 [Geosporobacter ferrireducens]MTI57709.1 DUF4097 domain-containing protein [Geosporobacter ferrireducens]
MNMKKIVIYLAIIAAVGIGTGLTIAYFTGGFSPDFSENSTFFSVDDTQIEKMDGITQMIIEGVTADINIIPDEREDVKAHFYGNTNTSDLPKMKVTVNGGRLMIKIDESRKTQVGFFSSNLSLDVFVPKTFGGDLELGSVSGHVEVKEGLNLRNSSVHLISGDTKIQHMKTQNLDFESISGTLTMEDVSTENTRIRIISGDVHINNFEGNLKGESTSGNLKISYLKDDYDIDFKAVSGTIDIDLPDDAAFSLDAETLGDIQCDFYVNIQGKSGKNQLKGVVKDGRNKVVLRNTSGNITVH